MRKIILILISFLPMVSVAQSNTDLLLGLGASNLGTGDKLIVIIEGEITHKWNRLLSHSFLLGLGYGDFYSRKIPQPTSDPNSVVYRKKEFEPVFLTHLDANLFISPLGNDKIYNLKFGTGASLLYLYDDTSLESEKERLSLGINAIIENEFRLRNGMLLGLKTMMQPYLNGDINLSILFKVGKEI
ncbi:hypothetical protein OKW21_000896 [Catalinimonas alkaloidigena]|uniref:hypothetical protein n=1 Tax=Catalinimonas alkaloidigena TaxID=1075417 RepID=UPI0024054FC9|nr:hypothetical protein [Catalinimonas alkaloidigena]MDF9795633.1 hypothetical protein [Catalinimonas alkaloidigena]